MPRVIDAFTQFFDNNGDPLIDGWLAFKNSGSNTDKDTFADSDLSIENTNPVQLDGSGRCPNVFGLGNYKVISYKDSVVTPGSPGEQVQSFDPVGGDFTGTQLSSWEASFTYSVGDIVEGSDGKLYRSLENSNQNNDPTTTPTKWEEVRFLSVWNSSATYGQYDQVIGSDGLAYTSLVISNTNNNPVGGDQTKWTASTTAKVIQWASNVSYSAGDPVWGSDGSPYFSLTPANKGNDPTTDSGVNWAGSVFGKTGVLDFYTDSGTADAYVLANAGGGKAVLELSSGMLIRMIPANTNTGASTANVADLGVKDIVNRLGLPMQAGDIEAGSLVELRFDLANDRFVYDALTLRVLAYRATNQSIPNSVETAVVLDASLYDNCNCLSGGVVNVPSGVNRMRMKLNVQFELSAGGARRLVRGRKNGTGGWSGVPKVYAPPTQAGEGNAFSASTGWIAVSAADTLSMQVLQDRGGALDVLGGAQFNWLEVEFD